MAFLLPFETELKTLDDQIALFDETDPAHAQVQAHLQDRERHVYENLSAHDTFLLSRNPLRPKTLDYVRYIFHDVRLFQNADVKGDHLVVAGEGQLEVAGQHFLKLQQHVTVVADAEYFDFVPASFYFFFGFHFLTGLTGFT